MHLLNKNLLWIFLLLCQCLFFSSCEKENEGDGGTNQYLQLVSVTAGEDVLKKNDTINNIPVDTKFTITFSNGVDTSTVQNGISIISSTGSSLKYTFINQDDNKVLEIKPANDLTPESTFTLKIGSEIKGENNEIFPGITYFFTTGLGELGLKSIMINDLPFGENEALTTMDFFVNITVTFEHPVNTTHLDEKFSLFGEQAIPLDITVSEDKKTINVSNQQELDYYQRYNFFISDALEATNGYRFNGFIDHFFTRLDSVYKFPEISDEALLTKIQQQTFRYFWDFGHPVSGMARERTSSGDIVTSGGSGFGMMAMIAAVDRGFITRSQGMERWTTMIDFLSSADRFHGAWPHWMNGNTGKTIPFSPDDDGGDLVETSFMAMGLMTLRQYLNPNQTEENAIITKINALLDSIEWDWYTQGKDYLTWHWSPTVGFAKNHIIRGWNEALITYVMAAGSSTHGISDEVYQKGWTGNGSFVNGKDFYDITLPLGPDFGGPLFFEHYSFLGLDPGSLSDPYANYKEQAVHHSLINHRHCVANPLGYIGYSEDCWGLTASDGNLGYSAHSPTNDRGVIAPTAAISSLPFTPEESMAAIKHFYYMLGDRLWGPYGFYDAFNITANWYANSNIAIDQGPIIVMIENYRSGLLWDLFMSAPEIRQGLSQLNFSIQE